MRGKTTRPISSATRSGCGSAFSEAVKVTGTPKLAIDMDPAEWGRKEASYEGARDAAVLALTFAWTVVEPNFSPRGIAVLADSLVTRRRDDRLGGDGRGGGARACGPRPRRRPQGGLAPGALGGGRAGARGRGRGGGVRGEPRPRLHHRVAPGDGGLRDGRRHGGAAKAGEDYTAVSGTLTFAAGERVKTVSVPILDDGHDEGHETFSLRLSNVAGAREGDLEATGTIENTDRMPKAWNARFGRTVAEQVVMSVQARLEAPRTAGGEATLGGQALPSWAPGSGSAAGPGAAHGDATAAAGLRARRRRGVTRSGLRSGSRARTSGTRPKSRAGA